MFEINGHTWYVELVPPNDPSLYREDGSLALGMCDKYSSTISINGALSQRDIRKVLCHEITHAAMFSYDIELTYEQEELIANIISCYGEEIIEITKDIFSKLFYR